MREVFFDNKQQLEDYINGKYIIDKSIANEENDQVRFFVNFDNYDTALEVYNFDPKESNGDYYSEEELIEILKYLRMIHHEESPEYKGNRFLRLEYTNSSDKKLYKTIDASMIWNEEKFIDEMKSVSKRNLCISMNYSNMFTSTEIKNLASITAFSIVLNYRKNSKIAYCSNEEIIELLEGFFQYTPETISNTVALLDNNKVPYPNIIEISDSIKLIYIINPIHLYSQKNVKYNKEKDIRIKNFVEAIKKKIEGRLKCFYVDETNDINAYLRFSNSLLERKFSDNGRYCNIYYMIENKIYFDRPYNLQDIADKFIPREEVEVINKEKNREKRKYNKTGILGTKNYNLQRLDDFIKVQELCNKQVLRVDTELLIYLYIEQLRLMKYGANRIIREVARFNNKFLHPMDEDRLIEICKKQLEKEGFMFRKITLREKLGLDKEACKKYGLESLIDREDMKEYKRLYQRAYYKEHFYDEKKYHHLDAIDEGKIKKDISKGLSVEKIAKKRNITKKTVYNHRGASKTPKQKEIEDSILKAKKLQEEGHTLREIAFSLNIDYDTLRKRLKK